MGEWGMGGNNWGRGGGGFEHISTLNADYSASLCYDTKCSLHSKDDENEILRFSLVHDSDRNAS